MYKHGDIVKPICISSNFEYHIITDVVRFEQGCRYDTMLIYPISKSSKSSFLYEREVMLIAEATTYQAKSIMELIEKDRKLKGMTGRPDYSKAIEANIHKQEADIQPYVDETIARYDLIRTIEEGVNALWDLNTFYEVFKDESYLQLKEIVLKRMNEIVKNSKENDLV